MMGIIQQGIHQRRDLHLVVTGRMWAGCTWLSGHDQGGNAACASRNSKTVTFPVAFSSVIFAGNAPYKLVGGSNYGTGQGVVSYTTTSITVQNTSETSERYWSAFQWCAIGY